MELLISISILSIIFIMSLYFFSKTNKAESLEKDKDAVVAFLREARNLAYSSKNSSDIGVHIETDKLTIFEGGSFVQNNNQKKLFLSKYTLISSSTYGDVIFNHLKGDTLNFGNVVLSLKDNSTSTTITILKSGVVQ